MSGRFTAIWFSQWKLQRAELLGLTLFAALIAPLAMWPLIDSVGLERGLWVQGLDNAGTWIRTAGAFLAAFLGALLAIRPFALDGRGRHTYPLALPLPRTHYALMRAAAGLLLAFIPATGFLIGALVAAKSVPATMPARAFPFALTTRFLLAVATAFAVFFGIQYGLGTRARRWLMIAGVTVLAAEVFTQFTLRTSVVGPAMELLQGSFSPLRIFLGRWMLFDV